MLNLFSDDGFKRPYRVVTMEQSWFEAARALNRPRFLFTSRLALMQFVQPHETVCVYRRLAASGMVVALLKLGATDFSLSAGG